MSETPERIERFFVTHIGTVSVNHCGTVIFEANTLPGWEKAVRVIVHVATVEEIAREARERYNRLRVPGWLSGFVIDDSDNALDVLALARRLDEMEDALVTDSNAVGDIGAVQDMRRDLHSLVSRIFPARGGLPNG